jgi:drug/metabolite transporter (DMT)-like permease
MIFALSILAAFACALCNGAAAVLQKVAADEEKRESGVRLGFLWELAHNWPYMLGILLDVLAWVLTFLAVQRLPLFLVESVIAANIAVTAVLERIFLKAPIHRKSYYSMGIILLGLVALALSATGDHVEPVSTTVRWAIILLPLPLVLAGILLAKLRGRWAIVALSAISGIAFGNTSVISRIFGHVTSITTVLHSPLLYSLIVSGVLGILLFSVALQRARATVVNASMTTAQIVVPTLIGLAFLGDKIRSGRWELMVIGLIVTVIGTLVLALITPLGRRTNPPHAADA